LYFKLGGSLLGFILAVIIARFIPGKIFAYLLMVASFIIASLFIPTIASRVDNKTYLKKTDAQFQNSIQALDFTPYSPTYTPAGMPVTPPTLNGYEGGELSRPNITFKIGEMEAKEDGAVPNQTAIINPPSHCDLATIWFNMGRPILTSFDIQRSQSKTYPCASIGMAPAGNTIYSYHSGQSTFFYTQLGTTNIMLGFDDINGAAYTDQLQADVFKIMTSLVTVPSSSLVKGSP
jgi:hypothetical protein